MHIRLPYNTLKRSGWLLLTLIVCLTPTHAVWGAPVAKDALTVTTTVTVHVDEHTDVIPLLDLTHDPKTTDEPALQLYWRLDTSGWFPAWQIELAGTAHVLPEDVPTTSRNGRSAVVVSSTSPRHGHTYEVMLSHSSDMGTLAMRIVDITDDWLVYAGSFSVPVDGSPLFATSGTVTDHYIPVATSWQRGLQETGFSFVSLRDFSTRNEPIVIRLNTPSAVPGEYRLYHVDGENETLIAAIKPDIGEQRIMFDATNVPLGVSALRLDYVDDGVVWLSETKSIVMGRLDFSMRPLKPAHGEGTVRTEFVVRGGESYTEDIRVNVRADLFELVWDDAAREFTEIPFVHDLPVAHATLDLSTGVTTLPVEIPIPDRTANWKVRLTPHVVHDIATYTTGNERLFSSHLPAAVAPGESYTIVVFPDTQYMAQSYPSIYTRMSDWVAANAATYNIAAALHVGDLTNNNTPAEWENAYASMSLLHGVVPYALTLGNHDMATGTSGAVSERGLTLINHYFNVDEARTYSNLTGTMVPDRLENHYHVFSIGDDDYVVIALEFGPPNEAIDWANEVAGQYPDHRLILLTHSYLAANGTLSRGPERYGIGANPDTTVNTAAEMWAKLMHVNDNSFMVVGGHAWPAVPVVPYRMLVPRNKAGNPVFELLFDWQGEVNGGNGWLGLMTFHPDNTVEVTVYSPFIGEYAKERDTNGFTSHMKMNLETGSVQRITY